MADTATQEMAPQSRADAAEEEGAPPAAPAPSEAEDERPDETSLPDGEPDSPPLSIEFLGDIEIEAAVELGRATLTIGEVLGLNPGSVVHLDKMLGDPAELVVSGRLIARGEVVVVDDRFGLRVTELASRGADSDRPGGAPR